MSHLNTVRNLPFRQMAISEVITALLFIAVFFYGHDPLRFICLIAAPFFFHRAYMFDACARELKTQQHKDGQS